ncbi:MAG TPA: PEGA domain-containing protein [Terriglobales bacterium]|nr:PEGA domain-containing protein [Terriglobales bacterium]
MKIPLPSSMKRKGFPQWRPVLRRVGDLQTGCTVVTMREPASSKKLGTRGTQNLLRLLSVFLVLSLSVTAYAQQTQPDAAVSAQVTAKLVLEDATPVKLRLSRNLSSADSKTGDTVDFEVLEEVRVGDVLVISKGGVAWGTVTDAEPKKRMGRGGKLNMTIDAVRLLDSEKAALRGVKDVQGGGHTGAMTGGIVAASLIVWPAAPFFLFMHGKDVTIPKGTEITAYINGNFPLDAAKFDPQSSASGGAVATAAPAQGPPVSQVSLEISSTPPGADIELDGSFIGNTPSSVGVYPGDHAIKLTKTGYAKWERKLKTSTGTVKVSPELEPLAASAAKR